jgi:hypothetical protein
LRLRCNPLGYSEMQTWRIPAGISWPGILYSTSSPKLKETLCTEVTKLVLINTIQPLFKQKRLLVSYVLNSNIRYHHITLDYKKSSSILIEENGTFEYLKDIKTVDGHYHICPSKKVIDNLIIINKLINDILTTDLKNDMDSLEQSIKTQIIQQTNIVPINVIVSTKNNTACNINTQLPINNFYVWWYWIHHFFSTI